uniref:ACYPI003803 protein n=1 Tax=Acyrthosiphon pisum TaxID=7029 RepID=C4WWD0_ACYPI|nr:ACYPI003803 [Acyrthosiphon pisum]
MIEVNFYSVVLVPLAGLISYAIWSRLRMPVEYRQISSHVPSVTKSFWSEMVLSWKLAMLQPKDILPFVTDLFKENGPVVHFNLSGRSYVLLNDPDDLKVLLSNTQYIKKGPEYEMLKPWLNEGLLLSSGQKWHNRRKLLTNTFHFKTLDMYNPSINKHSRILVDKLFEASANDDKEISIAEYVTLCSWTLFVVTFITYHLIFGRYWCQVCRPQLNCKYGPKNLGFRTMPIDSIFNAIIIFYQHLLNIYYMYKSSIVLLYQ